MRKITDLTAIECVQCHTQEQFELVCNIIGLAIDTTRYETYKQYTCVWPDDSTWESVAYATQLGHTIYPASTFLPPAQMKELREISDVEAIEVAKILYKTDWNSSTVKRIMNTIEVSGFRAKCYIYNDGGLQIHETGGSDRAISNSLSCLKAYDYLRSKGYNILNPYSVPAAVSAEEVEAILYKHTFDELEDDQYVFLRKGIFEAAKEIAAHPQAPKRDEVAVDWETAKAEAHEYVIKQQQEEKSGEHYQDTFMTYLETEYQLVSTSASLPSSVPAIDWERVEEEIYQWANSDYYHVTFTKTDKNGE